MAIKQNNNKKTGTAPVAATAAATRASSAPRASNAPALTSDRVALRAYEIWLESGCPNGQHEEHWYRAERELRSRLS